MPYRRTVARACQVPTPLSVVLQLGRLLAEAVSTIPRIDAEAFEKMFNSSLQDLLMVVYLGSLTRTQLALAQKLSTGVA